MSFTRTIPVILGSGLPAETLRAQLVDTVGANVGTPVTTGFVNLGLGNYLWHYAAFPDGHRGGVKFEKNSDGTLYAFEAVNPEGFAENSDAKTSSRSSHSAADVWAVTTRTLSSFGTLVTDVGTAVWGAATRTLSAFGFSVAASNLPTDYQQRAVAVTLPTPAPTGYGGGTLYGQNGTVDFIYTLFDTDGTTPLPGASVYVSSDSAGVQRSQSRTTDALGRVTFSLIPSTVFFFRSHPARNFVNPDSEVVSP